MAEPPGKPTKPKLSNIMAVSDTKGSVDMTYVKDGTTGGRAINRRQLAWAETVNSPKIITEIDDVGDTVRVSGLNRGSTYFFYARAHNAINWGPWSSYSTTSLKVPEAPTKPLLSSIRMTSVDVSWLPNGPGGSPITGYVIGWGTITSNPTSTLSVAESPRIVTGLKPNTTYYIRVRTKNSIGLSAWSPYTVMKTTSGCYIKVDSTWKLAVPYVKVAGVWRIAQPWGRNLGVWKPTID